MCVCVRSSTGCLAASLTSARGSVHIAVRMEGEPTTLLCSHREGQAQSEA